MNFNLLADATLLDLECYFPPPFHLNFYHSVDELRALLPAHSILLCRSTLKVTPDLLAHHQLNWLLTASSGRDHLDENWLTAQGIQLLDAKGSNANAVVDYVLSCLSYLMLNHDFQPKTVGIIGYGEVGQRLYQRLTDLGFAVITNDPLNPGPQHTELNKLVHCDLICLHANLHSTAPYPSQGLINRDFLAQRQPHQAIINASRGGIVDERALLAFHKGIYCTDVFLNEPTIDKQVVQHANLCTPHIAGHTIEAKIDAIRQLSVALHQKLGLTPPTFKPHIQQNATIGHTWQETTLLHYNPIFETRALKASECIQETFLHLRKSHLRHGFEFLSTHSRR